MGPYHNRQETYEYFSLPFCKGAKKTISHYHENLGEALQGVELEFSGLDVAFRSKSSSFLDVNSIFCYLHLFLFVHTDMYIDILTPELVLNEKPLCLCLKQLSVSCL